MFSVYHQLDEQGRPGQEEGEEVVEGDKEHIGWFSCYFLVRLVGLCVVAAGLAGLIIIAQTK